MEAGFGGQLVPVPGTGDGTGDPVAEAEMSFAELQAKRMSFVRTSWQDRATLGQLLLLVLCNEDLRRALLWVFAHDASVHPDVRSFAARSGVPVPGDHGARPAAGNQAKGAQRSRSRGQHGTRGHSGQGDVLPVSVELASGNRMRECLRAGAAVLQSGQESRDLPAHAKYAWSIIACRLPDPHALCQGVLISGLAQLWYRALCTYEAWPWPLLRLLHPSTGAEAKAAIAGVFFSVPPCCLDPGFSRPFRALLGELWLGTEAAGTVTVTQMPLQQGSAAWETCVASLVALRDPVARAVLEAVSTELEISVVDVECRHARFRRATTGPGGRPPNFGTVAARAFLRECELLHSQCTGTVPSGLGRGHLHHQLQEAQRALGLPGPEATPASSRKLKANPFLAFRAHCEKAHMSAHKQGLPGPVFGPSPALSVPPSPGSSVAQCSAPESGALSLATASRPRSKEFEQSVAAAYRNLTAADRQHWALAAAANKAGAGTGTGTVVPVCPLQPVQPVNAMARCRKQNCMPLVGNETCFIAETDLAVPCSVPAPSGPSAGDPGTCAPLVQLERQWDTYSYPKVAPPGTQCPAWYRTCKERGLCAATPGAASVKAVCSEIFTVARDQKPTTGRTVWAIVISGPGDQSPVECLPVMSFPIALAFCVAHVLWRPQRMIVIPCAVPGALEGGLQVPCSTALTYDGAGGFHFCLLEGFIADAAAQLGTCDQWQLVTFACTVRPEGKVDITAVTSVHPLTGVRGHRVVAKAPLSVSSLLDQCLAGDYAAVSREDAPVKASRRPVQGPAMAGPGPKAAAAVPALVPAPAARPPAPVRDQCGSSAGPRLQGPVRLHRLRFKSAVPKQVPVPVVPGPAPVSALAKGPAKARMSNAEKAWIAGFQDNRDMCAHIGCLLEGDLCCPHCEMSLCFAHALPVDRDPRSCSRCHEHNPFPEVCPCQECCAGRALGTLPGAQQEQEVQAPKEGFGLAVGTVLPSVTAPGPVGPLPVPVPQTLTLALTPPMSPVPVPPGPGPPAMITQPPPPPLPQPELEGHDGDGGSEHEEGATEIERALSTVLSEPLDTPMPTATVPTVPPPAVPVPTGPTVPVDSSASAGCAGPGTGDSTWSHFTDQAYVARVLEAAGRAPPGPGYRIYFDQVASRWYAKHRGRWVVGSSQLLSRYDATTAILRVHDACMGHMGVTPGASRGNTVPVEPVPSATVARLGKRKAEAKQPNFRGRGRGRASGTGASARQQTLSDGDESSSDAHSSEVVFTSPSYASD